MQKTGCETMIINMSVTTSLTFAPDEVSQHFRLGAAQHHVLEGYRINTYIFALTLHFMIKRSQPSLLVSFLKQWVPNQFCCGGCFHLRLKCLIGKGSM